MSTNFRIYKPRKDNDGSASSFEITENWKNKRKFDTVKIFLVGAKEIESDGENSAFAWSDKENHSDKIINFKLGQSDLGELLAVLNRRKNSAGSGKYGIYHENQKGNSALQFKWLEDKQTFSLRLSSKVGDDLTVISHYVSVAEAEELKVLLERAVVKLFGW